MLPDGFVDRAEQGDEGRFPGQLVEKMIQKAQEDCGDGKGPVLLGNIFLCVQTFFEKAYGRSFQA